MAESLDFFKNQKTYTFLNPRMDLELQEKILRATAAMGFTDHFWLASSGTENFRADAVKMIALSKQAFKAAAHSVCATQNITAQDVYLNTLPYFHVSGLSTLARAEVSGCKHISFEALNAESIKWNPEYFTEKLQEHQVSVTSLVPTQIFDLVVARITAPECLRFVYVGGGAVSPALQLKAESLGWKLVHTYGMTETAAMIAYGASSSSYELFPHIQDIRSTEQGQLEILSPALLTGYLFVSLHQERSEFRDPKQNGWFCSGDQVLVRGRTLEVMGRESELVKIKGESVSLLKLNALLQDIRAHFEISSHSVILALPEEREGFRLLLVVENEAAGTLLMTALNEALLPFERIQAFRVVEKIPMTSLNKVHLSALKEKLSD